MNAREAIEKMAAGSLRFLADLLENPEGMPGVGTPAYGYIMDTYDSMGQFLRDTAEAMRKKGEDL